VTEGKLTDPTLLLLISSRLLQLRLLFAVLVELTVTRLMLDRGQEFFGQFKLHFLGFASDLVWVLSVINLNGDHISPDAFSKGKCKYLSVHVGGTSEACDLVDVLGDRDKPNFVCGEVSHRNLLALRLR
jgi:hypothetical protein